MAMGMMTINRLVGKFAQIIELYDLYDNSMAKKKEFQESRDRILFAEQYLRGG